MPSISIIVPVYKVEPYLRQCVDSILKQTYTDFELILVDDGSPDNCGQICDEYAEKDKRVHVIHQLNGGLSAARNAGIDWVFANSNSEWITFVDSDDVIHPKMLERFYSVTIEYEADICACGLRSFGENTELQEHIVIKEVKVRNGVNACCRLYDDEGVKMTVAVAKLYKRELFDGTRYPIGKLHEDEATTYKLLYHAKCVVELDENYYGYRVNPTSIMNSGFSVRRFDALEALDGRILFFQVEGENELAEKSRWAYRTMHAKLIVAANASEKQYEIPERYQMSVKEALRCLKKDVSDENYCYYLSMIHPNWIRPHEYIRKIKKLLHIPCK